MNNFEFCNPVKVVFGKGSIARLSTLIPEGSKILMLYGGGSIKKNGIHTQVSEALKDYPLTEFSGIEANPHYDTCMKAVELARRKKTDFLLAVGGGSVIDATKFIAAAICFKGDPWDIPAKNAPVERAMPLGVVLTLSATGSETNERAVISNISEGQKLGFATPAVFPAFAVMDPEATYSLPAAQVANGVVDSFIHVIEQYLTYPVDAKVQDAFAESLMRIIREEGPRALKDPLDYNIRANLMWAATNALNGWIGQGVPQDWSSHRIGYPLTVQFGLAHAETLAVILPGVMQYMQKEKQEKILRLGAAVFDITEGSTKERVEKTIDAVELFFRDMGLKTRLHEYGIKETDLDALTSPIDRLGWKLSEKGHIGTKAAREILLLRL
ncbi:MAG: iron-containing alcohol dehydrogenase [Tannerellaceae bacterium]|jgi:NADP-dependent alcohol dehydrogenase|nr:iron-containing alcohol dehydrogenase [Tannerellaceae bacterium]